MGLLPKTKGGADPFEALSTIQKAIRRGPKWERLCLAYAIDLSLSSKQYFSMLMNRLESIAHEDISTADPDVVTYVHTVVAYMRGQYEKKRVDWQLALVNVVCRMCRATKSRTADHLWAVVANDLDKKGLPPVPDVALDMHTSRGRRLGRGIKHFLVEGARMEPEEPCPYKKEAEEYWLVAYAKDKQDFDPNNPPPKAKTEVKPKPSLAKAVGQAIADQSKEEAQDASQSAGQQELFDTQEPGWKIGE